MKFDLIIRDATIDEIVAIVTSPGTSANIRHAVSAAIEGNDDDESNDAVVAPGSTDKSGLPWDERIHSTPAKLTTKGAWRAKRGVTDTLVAQVEAELRARAPQQQFQQQPVQQMQPVQQQPQFQPQMQPTQIDPNFQPVASVVIPQQQPVQQMQPQGYAPQQQPQFQPEMQQQFQQQPVQQMQPVQQQPQQVQAPAPGTIDFQSFMQHVATISASGRADANYFQNLTQRISQAFNLPMPGGVTDLQKGQQLVDYAIQLMVAEGRWI